MPSQLAAQRAETMRELPQHSINALQNRQDCEWRTFNADSSECSSAALCASTTSVVDSLTTVCSERTVVDMLRCERHESTQRYKVLSNAIFYGVLQTCQWRRTSQTRSASVRGREAVNLCTKYLTDKNTAFRQLRSKQFLGHRLASERAGVRSG